MRKFVILVVSTIVTSCSQQKNHDIDLSGYARILDSHNQELERMITTQERPVDDLLVLMNDAIKQIIEQSGGYDPETGNLINGESRELGMELLEDIDFYPRLRTNLEKLHDYPELKKSAERSLILITNHWPKNNPDHFTVSEIFMGLVIAHNRILTLTQLKK